MRKIPYLSLLLAVGMVLGACHSKRSANQNLNKSSASQEMPIGDNSRVSVDWAGTYHGVLPCADCPGIRTVLNLDQNGTFTLQTRYLERGDSTFTEQGTFEWDTSGSRITLTVADGSYHRQQYLVGENQLFHLDGHGKRITGEIAPHFILKKAGMDIQDIYWELIEINGQSLADIDLSRDPYIRLNRELTRIEANGGCNQMGGSYELDAENQRLRFSQMMSTKMACPNMDIETQLADVLQRTDSYFLENDTLQLFRARMAPLAKFKAIYIK